MLKSYQFSKKYEILQLHQGQNAGERQPLESANRTDLHPNFSFEPPINGKLFLNSFVAYCCCFRSPCPKTSFTIQGYKAKLTETKMQGCYCLADWLGYKIFGASPAYCCHCFYSCCPPKYTVEDHEGKPMGEFLQSCCRLFNCCRYLKVSTPINPEAFVVRPNCCVCGWKQIWNVKDQSGNEAAQIKHFYCCENRYEVNFRMNLKNSQKLLLMSAVPFLP